MLERIELDKTITTYKPKNPFIAKLIKNEKLLKDDSENDTRHLVFDISNSNVSYVDGQSIGILAPGLNENCKAHRVRLYSIASCSYGDDGKAKTFSLCVKRANFASDSGKMYYGVCSNYLCDLKIGEDVKCSGPSGRLLCMPKDDKTKLIMLATGTGITPFRGFLKKIYEHLNKWEGGVSLYFGAKTKDDAYYMNSINNEIGEFCESKNNKSKNINFKIKTAYSREDINSKGERMYIQDLVKQDIKELFKTFQEGNFAVYVCGLKGITQGMDEVFSDYAKAQGLNWNEMKKEFKAQKRWNVEVY
jgi:ferredoxin--NADP+ reductase